ncbi:MAG TPA: VWA domain-containing protein, partial [Candidatus Sulfotelmatobacter sp.]|nr:VWA domain-containing protein [Candidatus Sulfotelmatobacter sp.]
QAIRSFDVHDFDPISDSLPKLPAELPANTFVNVPRGPERGPLYVLLLDLLNMDVDDQPTARRQLLEFIRNKPVGTRFAVFVLSDRLYQVQGFTEDRNALGQAVDPKNPHSRIPKIFLYADNFRPYISTPAIFAEIGRYLADLPGRKNLIWFSGSFPSSIMLTGDASAEPLSVNDQIKEATDSLARGRVAVYPVDVRGVVATSPSAGSNGSSAPMNDAGMTADATLNATYMTEEEIARATGGHAYHTTNDLAAALTAATETGGRYYTLTYSPSNQNYDGRLRHIKVELAKRGYRLEYRREYYGTVDSRKMEPARERALAGELAPIEVSRPSDSLYPNMQHGAPIAHQLLFRAYVHPVSAVAKATKEQMEKLAASIDVHERKDASKPRKPISLQTYQIDYTIAARYPLLEVAAAAYDDDGKILNATIERVIEQGEFPDAKKGGAIYRVQQKFDVPVNAATVRVAVRDVATDNVGALEIKLPLKPDGQSVSSSEKVSASEKEATAKQP